jgi:CxxC motif-containing protein
MKIKKIGNALHINTEHGSSVMPMTTEAEVDKVINTLVEVIYQAKHTNTELTKSVSDDLLVESFDTADSKALLNDTLMNVPSHVVKSVSDSISFAPVSLQPQVIKHFANAISRVYKDCAEMVLNAPDGTLLARSLLQKSILIGRDVEMMNEKLDEPLNKMKSIKRERLLRKSVLKAGVEQGEILAKNHYGEFDNEVLETARTIQKARNVKKSKEAVLTRARRVAK